MDAQRFSSLRVEFDALIRELKETQGIVEKRAITKRVEQIIAECNRLLQENRRDLGTISQAIRMI